jgi:hypothetical protein
LGGIISLQVSGLAELKFGKNFIKAFCLALLITTHDDDCIWPSKGVVLVGDKELLVSFFNLSANE